MAALHFAPATGITIVVQLDEIDRTVVLVWPNSLDDFVLLWIDLHECSRTDNGIERVVVGSDITVQKSRTRLLHKKKSHLAQSLKHAVNQVGLAQRDVAWRIRQCGQRI